MLHKYKITDYHILHETIIRPNAHDHEYIQAEHPLERWNENGNEREANLRRKKFISPAR